MKKSLALVLLGLLVGAGSARSFPEAERRSHFTDEVNGFSLDLPRFPRFDRGLSGVTANFYSPPVGGSSNSVKVAVQRMKSTKDEIRLLLQAEAKARGYTIKAARDLRVSGRDAVEVESEAKIQGRDLRWITLVVIGREQYLSITCTGSDANFAAIEAEFRACLASVRLPEDTP